MKKTFVLDTNVLLHDPRAVFAFAEHHVVIPIYVVEEVDQFKKDQSELGRNAREVARLLDDMRQSGLLASGAPTPHDGTVRVAVTIRQLPPEYFTNSATDNQILATALGLHERPSEDGVGPTIFVTKDINLRLRAAALGILVEDYNAETTDISELYTGMAEVAVEPAALQGFLAAGEVALPTRRYAPNEFVALHDGAGGEAVGRVVCRESEPPYARALTHMAKGMWGIRPRNKEQSFAAELLLDDSIQLVTLVGKAGTGKTLLAIAAGLQKVAEESVFQRLLVARPVYPLGRDIGFLPGDMDEKMNPWMQPIFDNVEYLMGLWQKGQGRKTHRSYSELIDLGILDIEPLTYIRGRSIPNQFMVVDEAQNLTPHEVKTIISRAGDHTKIVLTGDPYQIDNPYVDSTNNGLVHAVQRFAGESIAGHVTLSKGERSPLAELATNLL